VWPTGQRSAPPGPGGAGRGHRRIQPSVRGRGRRAAPSGDDEPLSASSLLPPRLRAEQICLVVDPDEEDDELDDDEVVW
jgi:hypothetical protein